MRARVFPALFVLLALVLAGGPALAQEDDRYDALFRRGIAELEAKRFDASVEIFKQAIKLRPEQPEAYYNIACAYSLKGDKDKALDWLAESFAHGFNEEQHIAQDSDLDPIRGEPRFKDLMVKQFGGAGPAPSAPPETPEAPKPPVPGKLLTLKGEPATLDALEGKVVIFELWRTWAAPCRQAAPALAELKRVYGPKGLEIVAISEEPAAEQERVADELKINYVLLRNEGALPRPLFEGVREVFPTFLIVGRDGRLEKKLVGARTKEELEAVVQPLVEGKPKRRVF